MPPLSRSVLVVLAVAALLLPVVPDGAPRDVLHSTVQGACVVLAWLHLRGHREAARSGWPVAVSAMALLFLSDLLRALDRQVWHLQDWPTPADALTLAGYLILGLSAVRLERDSRRVRRLTSNIEPAIFAVGLLTPLLVFVVLPAFAQTQHSMGTRLGACVLAAADLVIVTVVVRLLLSSGRRLASLTYFCGAAVSSLAADTWATAGGQGVDSLQAPVRVLWLLAFVLFAAGMADPSRAALTGEDPREEPTPHRRRLWLMAIGQAMPATALMVHGAREGVAIEVVLGAGALLVSGLVAARVNDLMDQISDQSERLSELARSDELTGLHNRRSWNFELARACAAATAASRPLSVALLDLDHFKAYNDSYGHPAGDRLLQAAARAWRSGLRRDEVIARYGGEEFAVLLPGTHLDEAVRRVEALHALTPGGQSFSAGVALWTGSGEPEQVMADADTALYEAKRHGRACVRPFRPPVAREGPQLAHALRTVVQPVVRLSDLAVVGYEALSRFDPAGDVRAVFAAAHRDGYGDLLEGSAVLSALRRPDRPEGVDLFVDVSEPALRSPHFWRTMPARLDGVVFEVLGPPAGPDDASVGRLLDRFRGRGARICLDEVGASQDDQDRVVSLRPELVKVDRSLVAGCHQRPELQDQLRRLLRFARCSGAEVCADGVETVAELAVLRGLGVHYAQGVLLGAPQQHWVEPLQPALRVGDLVATDDALSPTAAT